MLGYQFYKSNFEFWAVAGYLFYISYGEKTQNQNPKI